MEFVFAKDTLERKIGFSDCYEPTPSEVKAIGRGIGRKWGELKLNTSFYNKKEIYSGS